jgi:heat shock protein HslJ
MLRKDNNHMAFYGCFWKEAPHACREDLMNSEQKFESILEKSAHMLLHMAFQGCIQNDMTSSGHD